MTKWVVDANTILDWVVFGDQKDLPQLQLIEKLVSGKIELYTSEFLIIEVMNVLKMKYKYSQERVEAVVKHLKTLGINFWHLNIDEWQELLNIAYNSKLTLYDAHYGLVAQKVEALVITRDRDILENGLGIKIEEALKSMLQ